MIFNFDEVKLSDSRFGGKAYALAILSQQGFKVPPGIILDAYPASQNEFDKIIQWWIEIGKPKLAIRSSARGEDSGNYSFAGQNSTYLNVSTEEKLKNSIKDCFESIKQSPSQAYGKHFLGEDRDQSMNVLIQQMVDAKYSGVYFSKDPRGQSTEWILEAIDGLGEDLVSGKRTPQSFNSNNKEKWIHTLVNEKKVLEISDLGKAVKEFLNYEVDMEWAVDQDEKLFLLQARPITTLSEDNQSGKVQNIIDQELKRLNDLNPSDVVWDGQTFAEWTGYPSPLTYDLWREAFSPQHAFGNALKRLGYVSFTNNKFDPKYSILDKVFGNAFVNLEKLGKLFFGPIPYKIEPLPRPHLKFDFKKINLSTIIRTPYSIFKMLKVGWSLSTSRKKWLDLCRKELTIFKDKMDRPIKENFFTDWSDQALLERFSKEYQNFATHALHWPFILIILTESTLNSLSAILKSVLGKEKTEDTLRKWMSNGLETSTMEMNRYFQKACAYPETRDFFMSRYGHRGPGELDLSHKRWIELADKAFYNLTPQEYEKQKLVHNNSQKSVQSEINALNTFKRSIILQEWKLLKTMLELREKWKMELLKPYAHIRFLVLEIGKRLGIDEDVFWLDGDDFKQLKTLSTNKLPFELNQKITNRKEEKENFSSINLPQVIALSSLEQILTDNINTDEINTIVGNALSPGLVEGIVQIVEDINDIDMDSLSKETILVAKATDPGWTPLFTKVRGIVVEKGGILSHCAIVAREMRIPAVSGINQCYKKLKNGQRIWVDGNHGRINL